MAEHYTSIPLLPPNDCLASSSSSSSLVELEEEEGSVVIHEPVLATDTLESLAVKYGTTVKRFVLLVFAFFVDGH